MARDIALIALATPGLSDVPCHDPCHAKAAFIRAWMADDVDKGMLLIEQQHGPKEAGSMNRPVE
jgi:hypothetical protein